MKTKTVKISRKRWLDATRVVKEKAAGNAAVESCLYHPETKAMCCLGFVGRQVYGCRVNQIRSKGWLTQLPGKTQGFDRKLENLAIALNDDSYLSRREREAKLKKAFAAHEIRLVFTP